MQPISRTERIRHELGSLAILRTAGIIHPMRLDKLVHVASTLRRWGLCPAQGAATMAIEYPDAPALIDERGCVTFADLHRRTNALAHALAADGIRGGDRVAVMCRNHRGLVEILVAMSKLGADALLMNTSFAGPQVAEVADRENAVALVYDEEFSDLLAAAGEGRRRYVAWSDAPTAHPTLEQLIARGEPADLDPPGRAGRMVILTSGTTGTPRGVARPQPRTIDPVAAVLDRVPLRARWTIHIAAPVFHSWGLAHLLLSLAMGLTVSLHRRFDPEDCLAALAEHGCDAFVVIPVMLLRVLELPEDVRVRYDASRLKVVTAGSSALPGDLALRWMDEFGDNLHNTYGSTECGLVSIATPADLRAAPDTAGQALRGTELKLFDESGQEVPPGATGRIFVFNKILFDGYTTGGTKESIDGLISTGDVGRLDDQGRLYVQGRDDDMIVSGGENVFPQEVEDLLARHEAVADVAAMDVPDPEWGQRLRMFVVRAQDADVSEDQLKDYVKSNLARYKVPREIWFVDELPRNATGKLLKRVLRMMERPVSTR